MNVKPVTFVAGLLMTWMVAAPGLADHLGLRVVRAEQSVRVVHATAPLSPVEGGEGWGRVDIQDIQTNGVTKRQALVTLFGLAPGESFEVFVDGVSLGPVDTGEDGWGVLKLTTQESDVHATVAAELPAAGDLVAAWVVDSDGATVLQGGFVIKTRSFGRLRPTYLESIVLDDAAATGAMGAARVARFRDGVQELVTAATGLVPGAPYQVVVDGLPVGLVTADDVGQARLRLAAPDGDNPLPPELQPVENIRHLEWLDESTAVILAGDFTGASDLRPKQHENPEEEEGLPAVVGTIGAFTDDGWVLIHGAVSVEVVVTPETRLINIVAVDDLKVGDRIKATGTIDGRRLTAETLELKPAPNGTGGGVGTETLQGLISTFTADGFAMAIGMNDVAVSVSPETLFKNFSDLSDLSVGDRVKVRGRFIGDGLAADEVELKHHRGP